jgi:hypothetical protein
MSIRPKWLRDVCSILFSGYYILYANEGDEKVLNLLALVKQFPHGIIDAYIPASTISSCPNGGDAPHYLGENHESLRALSSLRQTSPSHLMHRYAL